jgi:hypothetical protein
VDIQTVPVDSSLRLYYKAKDLKTSQSVIFNVWDSEGTPLYADVAADGEIGSKGVYFLDITTPAVDAYLLVKGSLDDGSDVGVSIYSVGLPDQKVFYVHGAYATGQTIPYRIFDFTASDQATGNLTEVAGGFYYADVNEIESSLDLFFKVGDLVYEFDLSQLTVFVSGGAVVSGAARTFIVAAIEPISGILVDGAADVEHIGGETYNETMEGGVLVDGSAIIAIGQVSSGGIRTNGSAAEQHISTITPVGGAVLNGSAVVNIGEPIEGGVRSNGSAIARYTATIISVGGAILNGSAVANVEEQIEGGVLANGSAVEQYTATTTSTGGAVLNGSAIVNIGEPIEGGIRSNGSAEEQYIATIISVDGAVLNGSAVIAIGEIAEGGAILNGSAVIAINEIAEGGATLNGSAVIAIGEIAKGGIVANGATVVSKTSSIAVFGGIQVNGTFGGRFLFNEGLSGAILGGAATLTLASAEQGSGGLRTGGSTEGFLTFYNVLRDREYLFSVGDIVYIQDLRSDQPSRYYKHVVEGYRLFGNHNLYDIGIGILVEERFLVSDLNRDVILSDEAADTSDYLNYLQSKLETSEVRPDPVGGHLDDEATEGEECCIPDYADLATIRFMKKLEDLSNTTVLPSPSGGILAFTQQDGSDEVEASGIQRELDTLEDIVLLPDPTGAYIVVSTETEPV